MDKNRHSRPAGATAFSDTFLFQKDENNSNHVEG